MADNTSGAIFGASTEFEEVMLDLTDPMDRFAHAIQDLTDTETLAEFLAGDVIMADWTHPGKVFRGKEEVLARSFADIPASTPDARFLLKRAVKAGDLLILCGFFQATFTRDLPSYKATNEPVQWEARDMYRFRDGKIDRIWWANDTFTIKRMLGAPIDHERFWE